MKITAPLTPVRLFFLGIWVLCFTLSLIVWLVSYLTGNWSASNQVAVTQFGLCTARRTPLEHKAVVPADHGQLYACGYLQTEIPVEIDIYVFDDGDQIASNYLNSKKRKDGLFFEPLELESGRKLSPGVYMLSVHYGRSILAEEQFIVDEH